MSTRERWTVYPLLLLAIGLALRAGPADRHPLGGPITGDTIVCKELAIVDEQGKILVHAGRVLGGGGGRIEIRDAAGRNAVCIGTAADSRDGAIEFYDAEGTLIARLGQPRGTLPDADQPGPAPGPAR
jgi:hypothetical protein